MDVEKLSCSGARLQKMACCSVLHTILHAQRSLLLLLFLSCQPLSDINTFPSTSVRFPFGDLQKASRSEECKDSGESDDDDSDDDDEDEDDSDDDEDDDSEDESEDDDSDGDSDDDAEASDDGDSDEDGDDEDADNSDDDDEDDDSDEEEDTASSKR